MTVQEQISRLNNVFERWHEEFDRMDQKRQKLETIYAGDVQQIKARFAAEKDSAFCWAEISVSLASP